MSSLLRFSFRKVFSCKLYWFIVLIATLPGAIRILSLYKDMRSATQFGTLILDADVYSNLPIIEILIAFFSSWFCGIEFSDKTIRNKLVIGHSRTSILAANVIVSCVGAVLIFLLSTAIGAFLGVICCGKFNQPLIVHIAAFTKSCLALISVTTAYSCISLVISKQMIGIVTASVLAICNTSFLRWTSQKLLQPRHIPDFVISSEGEMIGIGEKINPKYIGGSLRTLLEGMITFSPSGQLQCGGITEGEFPDNYVFLLISSILLSLLVFLIAQVIFSQKDIT